MKKSKQLIVNLDAASLTKKNLDNLHAAIHSALAGMVKVPQTNKNLMSPASLMATDKPVAGKTAKLAVEFHNVGAGLSSFTATCNGVDKSISQSATVSFSNVKPKDTIIIKGSGAGSKTVSISGVNAVPPQMSFAEGQHINGIFLVLS